MNHFITFNTAFKFLILIFLGSIQVNAQEIFNRDEKVFSYAGNLSIQTELYNAVGIMDRQQPFSYTINANPTLFLKGNAIPFSILISNFNRQIQQPFDHFGISPSYKWIRVHLGYRNLVFSPFTLAGQRMIGAGIEINPGIFYAGFFKGTIRRAIEPDSTFTSTGFQANLLYGPGYKRTAWAAKIGVGKVEGTFVGVSFLKGEDQLNSLDPASRLLVSSPESNAVVGLTANISISKNIKLLNDVALSSYTRNTQAETIPLTTDKYTSILNTVNTPLVSTQYLTALNSQLVYKTKSYDFGIKFRRIDPDFKSMGAYYFSSDIQQITFNAGFKIKQYFALRGSFGTQKDNLTGLKQRSTQKLISSANVLWNPNRWFGISGQFANYGISQNPVSPNVNDTTLLDQVHLQYSLMPRLLFQNKKSVQLVLLSFVSQQLSNRQSSAFGPPEVNTKTINLTYSYTNLAGGFTIAPSLIKNNFTSVLVSSQSTGAGIQVSKQFSVSKIMIQGGLQWFVNRYDENESGNTLNYNLRANLPVGKALSFNAEFIKLHNNSSGISLDPTFKETRVRTGLNWTFNQNRSK